MSLMVTKEAPDFKAQAVMSDDSFKEITLSGYRGKYVLLFFYPLDFTFVCPTEIIAFDEKIAEFEKRNTQVIGVSVDSIYSHYAWKGRNRKEGGIGKVRFPLVSDITKTISSDYKVLLPTGEALRGLFLIDKNGIIRHLLVNDLPLGRSIDEALRMIDALQTFETVGEVCPANFKKGDRTLKPSQEGLEAYFS